MSRYDADDVYCIPGTAVLKNKAGITDQNQLDEFEGDFTAIRLLELTQNPVEGSFDLSASLQNSSVPIPRRLRVGRRSQKRGHHQGRKSFLQRSPYPVLLKYRF